MPQDPRENLIVFGQELLDALYTEHLFRQKFERIMGLARQNPDPSDPSTQAEVNSFLEQQGMTLMELLEASITGMEMAEQIMVKRDRYLLLRQTIEALETPRPTVPTPKSSTASEDMTADTDPALQDPQTKETIAFLRENQQYLFEDPDNRRLHCTRCGSDVHMTQECNK